MTRQRGRLDHEEVAVKSHFLTERGTACGRPIKASTGTRDTSRVTCLHCLRSIAYTSARYEAEHGRIERHLDIPYYSPKTIAALQISDASLVSLDVYATEGDDSMPIVAYIHGGDFHHGDKGEVSSKPVFFLEAGYTFVSINHRLLPDADIADIPYDVATALGSVHRNGGLFGGDPSNVFVVGSSTGGHLAALVVTRSDLWCHLELSPEFIRGVVVLDSGSLDLPLKIEPTFPTELADAERSKLMHEFKRLSPVHQVDSARHLPDFLLLVTDEERQEHAKRFHDRVAETPAEATVVLAADRTHATLTRKLGDRGDPYGEAVLDFMRTRIKS